MPTQARQKTRSAKPQRPEQSAVTDLPPELTVPDPQPRCNLPPDAKQAKPAAPKPPANPEPPNAHENLIHDLDAMTAHDASEAEAARRDAIAALVPLLEKGADRNASDTAALAEIAADLGFDRARLVAMQKAVGAIARARAEAARLEEYAEAHRTARAALDAVIVRHRSELQEAQKTASRTRSNLSESSAAVHELATLKLQWPSLFEFGSAGLSE